MAKINVFNGKFSSGMFSIWNIYNQIKTMQEQFNWEELKTLIIC